MKKVLLFLFVLGLCLNIFSQEEHKNKYKFFDTRPNKGKIFVSFGWNGSVYSKSNIHFKGTDYNFTLKKVKATDRQSPFSIGLFLNPATITIPQYNFKIGYFFHNNYYISINVDHMKYVMVDYQTVNIDGYIENTNTIYDNIYSNEAFDIKPDFLKFEHTDGLNYVNIEVNRFDDLLKFIKLENKWIALNLSEGLSAGIVIPRTDSKLLNNKRNDMFHISGYGFSGNMELNLTILQYFFIQYGIKGGFIDLPSIRTTNNKADKANQNFWFLQYVGTFGLKVRIAK